MGKMLFFARRASVLACAFALSALSGGVRADVVHRASTDFVLNQDRVTPYTNALGGVWSYWCCNAGKLGDVASRTAMATRQEWDSIRGLGWEAGNLHWGVPYVLVNPTDKDVINTGLSGGKQSPIHPGELELHPGLNGAYGIVRFTVPRTGRYAVRFTYRTLVPDNGLVNVYAVTNGVTIFSRQLNRAQRTDATSVYATNDLAEVSFAAGDVIETAVEMAGEISCDGVLVDLIVTERDPDGVWYDPLAAVEAHTATNLTNNGGTYGGPKGELYQVMAGYGVDDLVGRRTGLNFNYSFVDPSSISTNVMTNIVEDVTNIVTTVTTNGPVLKGWFCNWDSYKPYPIAYLNTNAVPFSESVNVSSRLSVQPGELLVHPGTKYRSIHHAFWPETAGTFDIGVQVRDLNKLGESVSNPGMGVRVALQRDCDILEERTISYELAGVPSAATFFVTNVFLFTRQRIELAIDNNGTLYNDATGVRWFIRRRSTGLPSGVASVNTAFAEEVRKASPTLPFTDAWGFTWDAGKMTAVDNLPSPATFTRHLGWKTPNNSLFKGWQSNNRPYVYSYLDTSIFAAKSFSPCGGSEGNGDIVPEELVIHPGNSYVYSAIRARVPRNGVWDLHAFFHHINHDGDGVDATIFVNGRYAVRGGQICNWNGYRIDGSFVCESLTLNEGDLVDFVIGPGPNGVYSCDLSGLQAFLVESAVTGRVVSVDFEGASGGTTFTGAGRLGGGTVGRWNTLVVPEAAATASQGDLWVDGRGGRTGVSVSLAAAKDNLEVDATGTTGCAVLDDGVRCVNTTNSCSFTVAGLTPGARYLLCAYGRGTGVVRVGGQRVRMRESWFTGGNELAMVSATADDAGCMTGTFGAFDDATPAVFAGLQICGPSFGAYVPKSTRILLR